MPAPKFNLVKKKLKTKNYSLDNELDDDETVCATPVNIQNACEELTSMLVRFYIYSTGKKY